MHAVIWGVAFVVSAGLVQFAAYSTNNFNSANQAEYWGNMTIFILVLALFFSTFALHLRGYVHLGAVYNSPALARLGRYMVASVIFMGLSLLNWTAETSNGTTNIVPQTILNIAFFFYVLTPFLLGIAVFRLRKTLGISADLFALVSAVFLIYGIYEALGSHFGNFGPQFLGAFVFLPVPETLLVAAGIFIFFVASRK